MSLADKLQDRKEQFVSLLAAHCCLVSIQAPHIVGYNMWRARPLAPFHHYVFHLVMHVDLLSTTTRLLTHVPSLPITTLKGGWEPHVTWQTDFSCCKCSGQVVCLCFALSSSRWAHDNCRLCTLHFLSPPGVLDLECMFSSILQWFTEFSCSLFSLAPSPHS